MTIAYKIEITFEFTENDPLVTFITFKALDHNFRPSPIQFSKLPEMVKTQLEENFKHYYDTTASKNN